MPKILKQKKLKRVSATIFKYDKKSKFYYVRFWVCNGYRLNGCHTQSLKVSEERLAEKEAEKVFKNFDFKTAIELNKKKINKSKRDYDKDIAIPYFKSRELENPKRNRKEQGQYNNEMKEILQSIDYTNPSEVDDAVKQIFYNLSMKQKAVATQRNYKIILTNQMNKALKNNKVPFDVIPDFPKLRGKGLRRLSYLPKERKQIRNRFRNEYRITEDIFYDETADFLSTCEAGGFRPGLELLRIRRNNVGWVNDPNNENPVMKITLLQTKKDRHTMTVADWYRDDVYPKVLNRHPNANELDYLFFPNEKNREKLFDRIRKNFERLSDDLGLFVKDGQNRPIYVYRHSFISDRRRKGVDANIVALHSNTSVQMINQHYQDMSDDHLLEIHNKVFPSRTKNPNYKVITKKS
ncbi:MAG: hypothetical protein QGF61_02145 [Pelagibacteraceae bacterium]|jgi:hypothetical protein|nr:hypothetical protein [Pelagibacteraceae bacterium]|tara:strand:- start:48 stop:1271 length:1224 start_codon:yes stop_codon:yes gene_type:complete